MHPNPIYRRVETARNLDLARERGFGVLAVNATAGPLLSHIPFVLNEDGSAVELHLVRSNPILSVLETKQPAVVAVQGPDAYVSPDWYGIVDQVPTWNYVAVHLRGTLELRPALELRGMLDRLSARFETRLLPKSPWVANKMTPEVLVKMMGMIVPCRLQIETVDGTWKLSQNKDDAARLGAADDVEKTGQSELAALMRNLP